MRGDLDWIVMKCLEKDRTRRYETANGLATDIQRHLRNEPVIARPPSPAYRFQKMIRRNKLAFAAAATVVAALLVGLILTFSQAKRARQAEQTIRRNAYVAQMSVAFQAFAQGDLGRARELLNLQRPGPRQDDLRGFDWRHLWSLCQSDELCSFDDEGAAVAAFSPDGKVMVYAWDTLIVRDVASRIFDHQPVHLRLWFVLLFSHQSSGYRQ